MIQLPSSVMQSKMKTSFVCTTDSRVAFPKDGFSSQFWLLFIFEVAGNRQPYLLSNPTI